MNLEKNAFAGTLQSNDCLIRLTPQDEMEIKLESPVAYEFGDQILETVKKVLEEEGIDGALVEVEDKGALDCTIEARLKTAIGRAR